MTDDRYWTEGNAIHERGKGVLFLASGADIIVALLNGGAKLMMPDPAPIPGTLTVEISLLPTCRYPET